MRRVEAMYGLTDRIILMAMTEFYNGYMIMMKGNEHNNSSYRFGNLRLSVTANVYIYNKYSINMNAG